MLAETGEMNMIKFLLATSALAMLAGCGNGVPAPTAAVEKPKTMVAGEYEVLSEVTMLASTDKSTPATKLKMGDKATIRACVAADGTPDPKMFVEDGDSCTVASSYARSGRLSAQYSCTRAGKGGVYPNADGNYTADGYKAVVTVGSQFAGDGDYTLTRTLTAKRVGACPAAGPAKA